MSLKIYSILPKQQLTTQHKPKITPKVADKTKQTNQAINRLAVRFGGDEETKPAKKTGDTFLKEVIAEQPIKIKDKNTKKETIAMKADKSADKMTKEDYDMSFRRAVYNKAMVGFKLTDADIKLADQTLKNAELYNSNYDLKTDVKDLREKQRESGKIIKVNVGTENLEKAKLAGQAVLRLRTYEAKEFDKNQAGIENETNQKFVDQAKVLWNTGVNTVEGTINTGIDLIRFNNGRNPFALVDPFRPRVDLSGIKADYQSEMMRTDVNGKLDGNGIKRGDFTEGAVTILAPLVVGSKVNNITRMTGDIVKPKIGNINIPVKVEVGTATTAEGLQIPVVTTETKPLREVFGKPKASNVFESRANGFPNQRIPSSDGSWNGKVGESGWLSTKPKVIAITNGEPVPYKNGFPIFDKWKVGEVKLPKMKGNHGSDFKDADTLFAKSKKWFDKEGEPDWKRAGKFRTDNNLTWHHHEDMTTMQLVPADLNNNVSHTGGASFVKRGNK